MEEEEAAQKILARISPYVVNFDQKRKLLEAIPEKELRQFLQKRGVFIFGKKDYIIQQMLPTFFSLDGMKELFRLAGWEVIE